MGKFINTREEMEYLYKCNSMNPLVGGRNCPVCRTKFLNTHNKHFCSNSGRGNCKDIYHNTTKPERMIRSRNNFQRNVKLTDKQRKALMEEQKLYMNTVPLFQGDHFSIIRPCCGMRMDFCTCKYS
jgi:hypothetical protein